MDKFPKVQFQEIVTPQCLGNIPMNQILSGDPKAQTAYRQEWKRQIGYFGRYPCLYLGQGIILAWLCHDRTLCFAGSTILSVGMDSTGLNLFCANPLDGGSVRPMLHRDIFSLKPGDGEMVIFAIVSRNLLTAEQALSSGIERLFAFI